MDVTLHVEQKTTSCSTVLSRPQIPVLRRSRVAPRLANALIRMSGAVDPTVPRSINIFPSVWPKVINKTQPDVVNVHWVGSEVLAIEDVSRFRAPLIFTIHDAWLFQGAEHLLEGDKYLTAPSAERRDLDSLVWSRKLSNWRGRAACVVSPSRWLADIAARSSLVNALGWKTLSIPNPIDTDLWSPVTKAEARRELGWPHDETVILFLTADGLHQRHKGFDLLEGALAELLADGKCPMLALVGPDHDYSRPHTINEGMVANDARLKAIYSASDCVVVPSRTENLPNVAVEAGACGVPVVAFGIGGLPEIVTHKRTGYLARPFDVKDLADGLRWAMQTPPAGEFIRHNIVDRFSMAKVADQYRTAIELVNER